MRFALTAFSVCDDNFGDDWAKSNSTLLALLQCPRLQAKYFSHSSMFWYNFQEFRFGFVLFSFVTRTPARFALLVMLTFSVFLQIFQNTKTYQIAQIYSRVSDVFCKVVKWRRRNFSLDCGWPIAAFPPFEKPRTMEAVAVTFLEDNQIQPRHIQHRRKLRSI